jgi:4-amino-4-deoxy-L-arabinose transferase-like glycosyltransferase
VVKLVLGILFINRLSIDLDEPFSIFHAQKNLDALGHLFVSENNPPLHFYLLHFWIKWFGVSAEATRSLSLIFSVLTLQILFQIGRKILHEHLGILLMILFTCSNYHHSFGLEARGYALFTFLFAVLILLLVSIQQKVNIIQSGLLGIVCAALFYTHYIAIVVIPWVILLYFIISIVQNSKKSWWSFAISVLIFTLLLLPYFPIFMERLNHVQEAGTWVDRPHWSALYGLLNKFLNGPLTLILFMVILVGLIFSKRLIYKSFPLNKRLTPIAMVFLLAVGIYMSTFFISLIGNTSVFLDRYLFFLSLGMYIVLGYATIKLINKNLKIIVLPILIFILGFNPFRTHNRESDVLVAYAKSFNGSYVITPPHYDLTFIYHGDQALFRAQKEGSVLFPHDIYPIYGFHEIEIKNLKKPVVLIDAGARFLYGEEKLKSELLEQLTLVEQREFAGGYWVYVFE